MASTAIGGMLCLLGKRISKTQCLELDFSKYMDISQPMIQRKNTDKRRIPKTHCDTLDLYKNTYRKIAWLLLFPWVVQLWMKPYLEQKLEH